MADKWDVVSDLLAIPDMMGGLQGLRPSLSLSSSNARCMRLCLMAVLEVVRFLQESCGEVNRGDVSALVSAYTEFTEVMGFLLSTFSSPTLTPPRGRQELLSFDFTLLKNSSSDLILLPPMDSFIVTEAITSEQRVLFQKRLKTFLFLLLTRLQEVLTQWFNGGLVYFDVFSANSLINFNIDNFEAKFDRLVQFLIEQNIIGSSLVSSWRSEYPSFSRDVVESVAQHFSSNSSILSFWLETPCFSLAPSYRCMWNALCSLGADVTESHHFEEEKFDFPVSVLPAEFQWGVQLVRLHQPSWPDNSNRGVWKLPDGVESHLSGVSQRAKERRDLYGPDPAEVLLSLLHRDLLQLQLRAIDDLIRQGIKDFKSSSPRKLKAIQLVLSLPSSKLPKTLEIAKNKLESTL